MWEWNLPAPETCEKTLRNSEFWGFRKKKVILLLF